MDPPFLFRLSFPVDQFSIIKTDWRCEINLFNLAFTKSILWMFYYSNPSTLQSFCKLLWFILSTNVQHMAGFAKIFMLFKQSFVTLERYLEMYTYWENAEYILNLQVFWMDYNNYAFTFRYVELWYSYRTGTLLVIKE